MDFQQSDDLYGLYIQNQIEIGERLTVLLGARFDGSTTDRTNRRNNTSREQEDEDVTFRGGVVYQVTPGMGLYASYAEAFNPNFGLAADGGAFDAETGTQYEAGVKTDLNGGRIRTTLAVYKLTRDNVLVPFPQFPGTQIQTGQQRSRGVEADLALSLTRNWNLTAAYAYTDVEIRRDTNPLLIGDRPINVPEHQANLWTVYDVPLGADRTLSLGAGGRYVGEREGALPNTFQIPDYAVLDAAVIYRIDRYRLQLNAYNLLDADYVDSGSPTGARSVLLGEPLTVRASLGVRY